MQRTDHVALANNGLTMTMLSMGYISMVQLLDLGDLSGATNSCHKRLLEPDANGRCSGKHSVLSSDVCIALAALRLRETCPSQHCPGEFNTPHPAKKTLQYFMSLSWAQNVQSRQSHVKSYNAQMSTSLQQSKGAAPCLLRLLRVPNTTDRALSAAESALLRAAGTTACAYEAASSSRQ